MLYWHYFRHASVLHSHPHDSPPLKGLHCTCTLYCIGYMFSLVFKGTCTYHKSWFFPCIALLLNPMLFPIAPHRTVRDAGCRGGPLLPASHRQPWASHGTSLLSSLPLAACSWVCSSLAGGLQSPHQHDQPRPLVPDWCFEGQHPSCKVGSTYLFVWLALATDAIQFL